MRILIDSIDLNEIKEILGYKVISGITTNPSLVSKFFKNRDKNSFMDFLKNICSFFEHEISVQVTEVEYNKILDQGQRILDISPNIVLKLPLTRDGIKACKFFANQNKKTNVTVCFSSNQALISALAGAAYVSVFIGRSEDNGLSGKNLIEETKKVFDNYKFATKILGASIRNLNHINFCSQAGIDAITISPKLFYQMIDNELSISAAHDFVHQWKEGNLILCTMILYFLILLKL